MAELGGWGFWGLEKIDLTWAIMPFLLCFFVVEICSSPKLAAMHVMKAEK